MSVAQEETPVGPYAVLVVQDQGVGIPAADLPHIFEQFYRSSNVVGRIEGTGLGLTTVWHIVHGHGGTINVASEEGEGTTFTVRLPRAEPPAARSCPPAAPTPDLWTAGAAGGAGRS